MIKTVPVLLPILLVGIALAGTRGYRLGWLGDAAVGAPAALFMAGAVLLPLLWLWLMTGLCERRIRGGGGFRYIALSDLALTVAQWTIMVAYAAAVLIVGWSETIERFLGGRVILVGLVLTLLPALIGLSLTWAIHYPIIRRLRHAAVLRALDEGHAVHEAPSRMRFVLAQLRGNLLFLLVPLLLIAMSGEIVDRFLPLDSPDETVVILNQAATFGLAAVIFLCAPLMARVLLDVKPMPAGEIRDDLLGVCKAQRVRVRDVLLWRTDGSMINAAVMGLLGRLRYVLITDALLESLKREEVLAVMAHEVGHVRRHHMPWMIVALLAALMLPWLPFAWVAVALKTHIPAEVDMVATLAFAYVAFGWVSRRFERQADTFAAQHLSGMRPGRNKTDEGIDQTVKPEAASALQSALERVARLNGIHPRRRSWRHGSIRWRQQHLGRIVGRPLRGLAIDRQVRWIKLTSLAVLVGSIGLATWLDRMDAGSDTRGPTAPAVARADSLDTPSLNESPLGR